MTPIEFAPEVNDDFDRIFDHLAQYDPNNAASHIREIIHAIAVLEHTPLIGKAVDNSKRELIIGRPPHGYIALYRYLKRANVVVILAIRSQREIGYSRST